VKVNFNPEKEWKMKKVLLLGLAIMLCASMAYGQAGVVGIYADQAGTTCFINPHTPGGYSLTVYLVHTLGGNATGVGFDMTSGGGFVGSPAFSTITIPFVAAGAPWGATGVGVGYGSCIATPIMVYSFLFNTTAEPACSYLAVGDAPLTAVFVGVEVNDCNLPFANSLLAPDTKFFLNGDQGSCGQCAVPVLKKSWGKIKSMYN
jgi:hypothetical protein